MANPYHDGTGKFCSKEQMQDAIEVAKQAGDLDQYFELRRDYELIEQKKTVITQEMLSRIVNSGLTVKNMSHDDAIALFNEVDTSTEHGARRVMRFIQSKDTPEEVINQICSLPDEEKQLLIKQLHEDRNIKAPPGFFQKFLPQPATVDSTILANHLDSLTIEEKVNYARSSPTGLGTLLYNGNLAMIVSKEPELAKEIREDIDRKMDDTSLPYEDKYDLLASAAISSDTELQKVALRRTIELAETTQRVDTTRRWHPSPLTNLLGNQAASASVLTEAGEWVAKNLPEALNHYEIRENYIRLHNEHGVPVPYSAPSFRKEKPRTELEEKMVKALTTLKNKSQTTPLETNRAKAVVAEYYSHNSVREQTKRDMKDLEKENKRTAARHAKAVRQDDAETVELTTKDYKARRTQIEDLKSLLDAGSAYTQGMFYLHGIKRFSKADK